MGLSRTPRRRWSALAVILVAVSRTRSVSVIVAGAMLFVSCGGASRGVSSAAADDPTTVDVQQRLLVVGLCEQGVVSQMISTGKDKITWTVCGQHDELSVATFATATDLATFLKDQRSFCRSGFFEG